MSRKWERRFYNERDRRYKEVDRERRRAAKLYLAEHLTGERSSYASKDDLAKAIHDVSIALTTGLDQLETRLTAAPRRVWGYITTTFGMIIAGITVVIIVWPKH